MSKKNQYRVILNLEGFHPIEIGQKIGDCEFGFEQDYNVYFISTVVSAENPEKAKSKGVLRLERILSIITLQTGVSYPVRSVHMVQISGEKPFVVTVSLDLERITFLHLKKEKIEEIKKTIKLLDNLPSEERSTAIIDKGINYFLRGCFLECEWRSESFLNFYKAIELITNEFRKEFDVEIKNQLNDTILCNITDEEVRALRTPKRQIQFSCEQIGITPSCNISKIVTLRNEFSAHARLKEVEVSSEDKNDCKSLAAMMILWYVNYVKTKKITKLKN